MDSCTGVLSTDPESRCGLVGFLQTDEGAAVTLADDSHERGEANAGVLRRRGCHRESDSIDSHEPLTVVV